MNARILSMFLSALLFVVVLEFVRREKLTFKYAAGWLLAAAAGFLIAVFDQWVYRLAEALGFRLTSNFIFYVALCTFVFLSFVLTIFLCQQNERNDKMAQKLGILEAEFEELKKKSDRKG